MNSTWRCHFPSRHCKESPQRCDQTEALKIRRNKSPRELLPMYLSNPIDLRANSIPNSNGRRHRHCSVCPYSCSSLGCHVLACSSRSAGTASVTPVPGQARESHPDSFSRHNSVFSLPGILLRDHHVLPEVWGEGKPGPGDPEWGGTKGQSQCWNLGA